MRVVMSRGRLAVAGAIVICGLTFLSPAADAAQAPSVVVTASSGTVTIPEQPRGFQTEVLGEVIERSPDPEVEVLGQVNPKTDGSSLPVTGADVIGLAVIGAAGVAIGSALLVVKRRSSTD